MNKLVIGLKKQKKILENSIHEISLLLEEYYQETDTPEKRLLRRIVRKTENRSYDWLTISRDGNIYLWEMSEEDAMNNLSKDDNGMWEVKSGKTDWGYFTGWIEPEEIDYYNLNSVYSLNAFKELDEVVYLKEIISFSLSYFIKRIFREKDYPDAKYLTIDDDGLIKLWKSKEGLYLVHQSHWNSADEYIEFKSLYRSDLAGIDTEIIYAISDLIETEEL